MLVEADFEHYSDGVPKEPKKCIFCGRSGLSKEHIFADWIKKYVPRTGTRTEHIIEKATGVLPSGERTYEHVPGKLNRPGDIASQKLRVVCEKCNNVWMSQIQTKSKPALLPLILGRWEAITPKDCAAITTWAMMVTMVGQFSVPNRTGVHQEERTRFYGTQAPLPNWFVWVARYAGTKLTTNTAITVIRPSPLGSVRSDNANFEGNTIIANIFVGKMFLHVVYTTRPNLLVFLGSDYMNNLNLTCLWPGSMGDIIAPPVALSDDGIADFIRHANTTLVWALEQGSRRNFGAHKSN